MSSLPIPYQSEVVNTYPMAVDYTLWYTTVAGAPVPGPTSIIPPNTLQMAGNGTIAKIVIRYRSTAAAPVQEISIPYGSAVDMSRPINVLWNTNMTTQVVVIVETSIEDPAPSA